MSQKKLQQAMALHAQGDVGEAATLYRRILKFEPANAAALHGLAALEGEQGNHAESLRLLERLVKMHPREPSVRNNFANALRASGARDAAIVQYTEALQLRPDYAQAWCNRGAVLNELGRHEEALASIDEAMRLEPASADASYNRGNVLHDMARLDEAAASYARALDLDPDHAEAWCNRGRVLFETGRAGEALACFERTLELQPEHGEAWALHGGALNELKRPAMAIESCERAMAIAPAYFGGWWNGAIACLELKRYAEALRYFRKAVELAPGIDYGPGQCLLAQQMLCEWEGLESLRQAIIAAVREGKRVATPFVAQAATLPPAVQRTCTEIHVANICPASPARANASVSARERLRIGYVSGDLRDHPVGYQVRALAQHHDRAAFEIVGVSLRRDDSDPVQRELRRAFDEYHDVSALPDAQAAERIRALDLDIAIDVHGHMHGGRMGLFAAGLAPLQLNYLCPGTSGAPCFDYILTDATVVPAGEYAAYTEQVATLPDSFFVTDYRTQQLAAPPPRAAHGLPGSGFVFASFCESYKIVPRIWDVWMRLLRDVPGSVLWLGIRSNAAALENLAREASSRGIAAERLVPARFVDSRLEHLSRLQLADLCLDTPGYNGQTTTADALWAGVPVVAVLGEGFSARVAASLLHAAGLQELVATDLEQYEALARQLARESGKLQALRARLAAGRLQLPLFDTARTVKQVEAAYRHMVARARAGLPPAHFVLEDGVPC